MTISHPIQRAAAVMIILAAIWCCWEIFMEPIFDQIASGRQSIAQSERLLAAYNRAASELPVLERQLAALRANGAGQSGFLDGSSPPEVAAQLQNNVQQIVAAAGAALRSSQTLPEQDEGQFSKIGIQLELGANPKSLQKVLYEIESARPSLFIDELSVQAQQTPDNPDAVADDTPLTVRLQIHGFLRVPPS